MAEDQLTVLSRVVQQNSQLLQFLIQQQNREKQVTVAARVRPDTSNSIETFNGTGCATDWLQQFNQVSNLSDWSNEDKLMIVSSKLTDVAKHWQMSTGSACKTWKEWEEAFCDAFEVTVKSTDLWRTMAARVQQRDESIVAYIRDKERMCAKLKISEQETLEEIITGFRSRHMSCEMRGKNHGTVNGLIRNVLSHEQFLHQREQHFGNSERFNPEKKKYEDKKKIEATKGGQVTSTFANRMGQNIDRSKPAEVDACYNCYEKGHFSRDCPKPKRQKYCTKCRKEGHGTKDCPVKTTQLNISRLQVSQHLKTDGAMKTILVNNMQVNSVIDTAGDVSMMKIGFAKAHNIEVQQKGVQQLKGVGGLMMPIGTACTNVRIDDVLIEGAQFQVVNDDTFDGSDMLIGNDIIDLPSLVMIRKQGQSKIIHEDEHEFLKNFNVTESGPRHVALKTTKALTVEPRTVQFVNVENTDGMNNGFLSCGSRDGRHSEVLLVVRDGRTQIPVINPNFQTMRLKSGQVVMRGSWSDDMNSDVFNNDNDNSDDSFPNVLTTREVTRELIKCDQIKVGPETTEEERQKICDLLNEFRICIAMKPDELGYIKTAVMHIDEVPGSKPVVRPPRRTSYHERQVLRDIVQELKAQGVLRDSTSNYSSPVLLVPKKTGEYRMVIDYRQLNAQTIKDKFPIPCIDDLLDRLSEFKLFCILDACQGFNQIPMDDESARKAAFSTPDGHYEPTRLFFGLANGPAVFQRAMTVALGDLLWCIVLCFIDDMFTGAKDFNDMMVKLRKILERLREAGVTLRLAKCEFAMTEIEFLGFMISGNGISPGPRKLAAVAEFPVPTNREEVRRFLGLTGFFRRFIRNYATLASPLTALLKSNHVFEWTDRQHDAFVELRNQLVSKPVLKLFDYRDETELHTDASSVGLAGMLMQRDGSGRLRLVYCVSRRTHPGEEKYHSSRLELIAVVWAMTRLRPLLLGIHFVLVTDCSAIVYLKTQRDLKPQVARWAEQLGEFDYEVKHRPGTGMAHVDALSRAPVEERGQTPDSEIDVTSPVELTSMAQVFYIASEEDRVALLQAQDTDLKEIIDILRKPMTKRTRKERETGEGYQLINGILYRIHHIEGTDRKLFVMPKAMRKYLAVRFHDFSGHSGTDKVVAMIKRQFWFPRMTSYVKQHVRQCVICAYTKEPAGKKQGELNPIPPGKRPFEIIHMDFLGPFVVSSKRNKELLVMVDNLTKFVRLRACTSCTTTLVLKHLEEFTNDFGAPKRIVTDRGTCFTSRSFEDYCKDNSIKHTLTCTQRPQANGQVERINRVLIPMISSALQTNSHRDWDRVLPEVQRCINWSPSKTTGKSAFEVLYGFIPTKSGRFPEDLLPTAEDYVTPGTLREEARNNILEAQAKMKKRYDSHHCVAHRYLVGDVIVVRRLPEQTGESTKTQVKYRGPMVVVEVLPSDTYRISDFRSSGQGRQRRQNYITTAHASQMKLFHLVDEDECSEKAGCFSDDENFCDTHVREKVESAELVHSRLRPKRNKRLPNYMKDYVIH